VRPVEEANGLEKSTKVADLPKSEPSTINSESITILALSSASKEPQKY